MEVVKQRYNYRNIVILSYLGWLLYMTHTLCGCMVHVRGLLWCNARQNINHFPLLRCVYIRQHVLCLLSTQPLQTFVENIKHHRCAWPQSLSTLLLRTSCTGCTCQSLSIHLASAQDLRAALRTWITTVLCTFECLSINIYQCATALRTWITPVICTL